jgi:hypothetical protein
MLQRNINVLQDLAASTSIFILKIEAARSSEMSVSYHNTIHGITTHKTSTLISTTVKISSLASYDMPLS